MSGDLVVPESLKRDDTGQSGNATRPPREREATATTASAGSEDGPATDSDATADSGEPSPTDPTGAAATGRWRIGLAVALVTIGIGVLAESLPIFAASLIGLTYAAAGRLIPPPALDLAVERSIEPASPTPGSTPTVTVSVTNDGTRALPAVRIVDTPPAGVESLESPRSTVSIQPGETARLRYEVRAKRGVHDFGDVRVVASNAGDGERRLETHTVETTLRCEDRVDDVSVVGQTSQHAGRVGSTDGGSGVEFHAIRAYQPTDPINRIDWTRLARTGELATIDFRQERAIRVVCVVDDREEFALVRRRGEADALELSRHAVAHLARALLAANNHVGVARFGGRGHYLKPGAGRTQAARIERVLEGDWNPSFGRSGWLAGGIADVDRCCRELADEKHLVVVSPLLDDEPVDAARRFAAYGHDVTVVSPAVTPESPGGRLASIERESRLSALRGDGIHVVDWSPAEPLAAAMDGAARRWSA